MKIALFFVFLLIASSYCVTLKNLAKANSKLANQLKEMQTTKLGKMLVSLVEVHMQTNGPLDELFQELAALLVDTQAQIDQENANFVGIQNTHDDVVQTLNALISQATSDISTTTSSLNDVLYPQLATLQETQANLNSEIETTNGQIDQGTAQRAADNEAFLQFQADSNDAIDALNEAIGFVSSLVNQPAASLIQVRQAKKTLNALSTKKLLKTNLYTPLIKALISLSQNFSNQEQVQQIIDLLNGVLNDVNNALTNSISNESDSQIAWENQLADLQGFLTQLTADLQSTNDSIDNTNAEIAGDEQFLLDTQTSLDQFNAGLQFENDGFDTLTSIHASVLENMLAELQTLEDAQEVLDAAKTQLTDYVQGVMNS